MKKLLFFIILFAFTIQSFQIISSNNKIKEKTETYNSLKKYIESNNLQINLEKSLFLKKKNAFNNIASSKSFNFYKKKIDNKCI